MKIKCGNCGKDIVVPDDLVVGQHVRCPYCDVKSAFDKPSRVELPEGFESKRRARTKINELKKAHQHEAEMPPQAGQVEEKRKLGVIRPAAQASGPDLNAEAIKRRMEEDADIKRRAGEKVAAAQKSIKREKSIRRMIGVTLVVLVAAGIACWIGACSRERTRKRIEMLQRHEQRMREEERQRQLFEEEAAKRRAEADEKAKAARAEAEEAARKTAAERKARQLEEERIREVKRAEEERREAERAQLAETYKASVLAFRNGRFCMADNRKIVDALGARSDAFYFCLASEGGEVPIYEVSSASNGARRVVRMAENGVASEVDFCGFTNQLNSADYLMAHGQQMCYRAARSHPMTGRLALGACMDPTKAFFDKMYETVKALELEYDELSFDVAFQSPSPKKEVAVATVGFGCEVSACQVRTAVVEAFPMVEQEGRLKVKKFKRTVMFWNGHVVKHGADGIIYVPRCVTNSDSNYWRLKKRVEEDEAAEQEYYSNVQAALDEKMSKENEKLRAKWVGQIEEVLKRGILTYRAKISKEGRSSSVSYDRRND